MAKASTASSCNSVRAATSPSSLFCISHGLGSNTPTTENQRSPFPELMTTTGETMSSKTVAERLKDSVLNVTKDWAKQRKAEERHASAEARRRANLIRRSDYHNFRSAAFEVMEQAYMAASANGTLPAMARQVMYQVRPLVQELMGGEQLNDQYFCQQ